MSEPSSRRPKRWQWLLWGLLGLGLGLQTVRMRVAEGAVRDGKAQLASQVRPQNGWGRALNAERLFEQGNVAAAKSESLAALRQTPLAVVALRTLALARDKEAGPGAGESAWQAAAQLGWRDKQTQLWGVLRALANGEAEILAMRADALLRSGDEDGRLSVMIRSFMREPEVRAAFVERLALNPTWRRLFLTIGLGERGDDLDGLVATLRDLGRTEAPPTRYEIRMAVDGLIARRRFGDAIALHTMVAKRPPGLPLDDGGFERPDNYYRVGSTPFEWMIHPLSHSSASLDESEGRSMTVSTVGQTAQSPLFRYVPLDPGAYRLSYSVRGEPTSPAAIVTRIACAPAFDPIAQSASQPLRSRDWQTREVTFRIGPECPVISIGVGGVGGEAGEAQFDNFRLERI
jgi:hypothetical protein